ncbi:DUF397 domain-containing protein [Streptomyces sp. HB132]|uniref:DUF397 domain-containing protein n=1 Tax=Streptomyces sp. HB132 TaxID=767388 RepID=UPI001960B308|nr:DUF397 domain-containing protein [Streptomyces sp. HB132]MBM7439025.1 hypothetical protein [Streptomyces sp. HB132]
MTDHVTPIVTAPNGWRKSSHSNSEGGSCVEVLDGHPSGVPVRDSKTPHGPTLLIPAAGWTSFIYAVRTGDFTP